MTATRTRRCWWSVRDTVAAQAASASARPCGRDPSVITPATTATATGRAPNQTAAASAMKAGQVMQSPIYSIEVDSQMLHGIEKDSARESETRLLCQ